jgi:tetratricopeptide (TPR) repeat protein
VAEAASFHYRAFLSYSHRDTPWARWLHSALEGYRVEKDLVGRETPVGPIPASLRPIFRDREDFSAGHSLTEQTSAALEGSQFMIVLCSPNAAKSLYVNEEIRRFKAMGRGGFVIPVIVDGEPGDPERDCFPPALRFKIGEDGALTDEREEPIAADVRPQGDGKDGAKHKLVAGMLGLGLDEIMHRAERARRRRLRNWVAAMGVATATFAGLTVWAEINRREANVQRQHAVDALSAAAKTANSLTFGLAKEFRDHTGVPAVLVKSILDRALELQQQLSATGQTSTELKNSEAGTYLEAGLTLSAIGDRAGALDAENRARQIFETLLAQNPGDTQWEPDLALSYMRMGDILLSTGKRDEALAAFTKAVALRQKLADKDPDGTGSQDGLAIAEAKIGDVAAADGRYDDALAAYGKSVAITQKLADNHPSPHWQRELATCYERRGDALESQGKHDAAMADFQKRLEIAQKLVDSDPNNAEWLRDLGIAHGKIGDVLLATNKPDGALASFQQWLAITQRLAASDAGNEKWQRDVAVAYYKIADALIAAKNADDGVASYQKGLDIEEKLAAADPGNLDWQRDVFLTYVRISNVLGAEGKRDEERAFLLKAEPICIKLAASVPNNPNWQFETALISWTLAGLDDDRAHRLPAIVATLTKLKDQNQLTPAQTQLLTDAQAALADPPAK